MREDPASRKAFLRMVGGGGAAALATLLAACGDDDEATSSQPSTSAAPQAQGSSGASGASGGGGDLEIVNYALTLEYLEADFYMQVIDSGQVKDAAVVELAKKFGQTEQEHVEALMGTAKMLGTPAEKPQTNFDAVLEGGPEMILKVASTVENLGAAAYLGQAGRIESKEILAAALSIHTVEARHAAALNQLAGRGFMGDGPLDGSIPDGPFAKPMDMQAVLAAVQPYLA